MGRTYRYCVVVASAASSGYFLDPANPTAADRFVSAPVCADVTIAWAARVEGEVREEQGS